MRLQLAVLLSTAFLLLGAWAKPFKRDIHDFFYAVACFVYVAMFMSGGTAVRLSDALPGFDTQRRILPGAPIEPTSKIVRYLRVLYLTARTRMLSV